MADEPNMEENMDESMEQTVEDAAEVEQAYETERDFIGDDTDWTAPEDMLEEELEQHEQEETGAGEEEEDVGDTTAKGETKKKEEPKRSEKPSGSKGTKSPRKKGKIKIPAESNPYNEHMRCGKCKHIGHDPSDCTWESEKKEDGYFKISVKMMERDCLQKRRRNAVHVAGVSEEDFGKIREALASDILSYHMYLLDGTESRKWYVEMIFTSKETTASALESLPNLCPDVEVEKHDYHLKTEGEEMAPECLRDKHGFHPLADKVNPQPGYKHILYIAEVNDDTLPQLYEKFLPDIVALEIDSVREKIWFVMAMFATSEALDQGYDFIKSVNSELEMEKQSVGPRPLAKNLKMKYKVKMELTPTRRDREKERRLERLDRLRDDKEKERKKEKETKEEKPKKKEPESHDDKESKGHSSRDRVEENPLEKMIYVAPMSVEETSQLIEKLKTDVKAWKLDLLPTHENKMFVELCCSSDDMVQATADDILIQYPQVEVELPYKTAQPEQYEPGEKLRHRYVFKLDTRIKQDGLAIALLSAKQTDIDHEDLSLFWEALPNALDIFAPRNEDGTFKRYVIVWVANKTACTKIRRQNVHEIGGTKYLATGKLVIPPLSKLYDELEKITQCREENEALQLYEKLQKRLEYVNYYIHWAGDFEFDDADVKYHQKNLKRYLGLGLNKIHWCKRIQKRGGPQTQSPGPGRRFNQRLPPQKRSGNSSDDYGGKRSRRGYYDDSSSQYSALNAMTGLPNANPVMMQRGMDIGWSQMGGAMGMGNMAPAMMNPGYDRRNMGYYNEPRRDYSRGFQRDPYGRSGDMYDASAPRDYYGGSSAGRQRGRRYRDPYDDLQAGTSRRETFEDGDEEKKETAMKLLYGLTQLLK